MSDGLTDMRSEDVGQMPAETRTEWKAKRRAQARALAGLGEPVADQALEKLGKQLEAATYAISQLAERIFVLEQTADPAWEIKLENREPFELRQSDLFAVTLASLVAMRGGEADLLLRSGVVVEKLRMGELASIATQAMSGGEDAAG